MKAILPVVFCFLPLGLFAQSHPQEQAVIQAALTWHLQSPQPFLRGTTLPIANSTSTTLWPTDAVIMAKFFPGPSAVAEQVAHSFGEHNASSVELPPGLPTEFVPVNLMELASATGYDWDKVSANYDSASSIWIASRPGFDDTGNTAVLRVDVARPSGPAFPWGYRLDRDSAGAWHVTSSVALAARPPAVATAP